MIGKTISHYKILEKLGEGGMGVVYKAEDAKLKRTVALKFLPPELTRDPEARQRFIREAQAASALEHQNICNIHEIDETDDGQVFIVMAYYEEESLKKKIERGPLKLDAAVDIATQMARGLDKAHRQGIVHRDVKPANVMITEDGVAKIVDFSLAKLAGRTKVTKTGTTLGTAAYMSPEQARGEEVDHRTDIWSLGVVLYEMVTGQLPFKGEYEQALVYSILNEEPEPLTGLRTGVPLELERIVSKALAKEPAERYQHVDEMLVDLRSITKDLKSRPVTIKEMPTRPRLQKIRSPFVYGIVAALVILFLAVGYYLFTAGPGETIDSIAVLPLENLSGDPEQQYFVDGITEALITELSKIGALRVISRTSVMRYKKTDKPLPQIARELNVNAVVEGSVLRAGQRVRITAQLIGAMPDRHLWAESYDRELEDILILMNDVARTIAREIQLTLTPQEQARLTSVHAVNPEAYEFYIRGRYQYDKWTKIGFEKAIEYFEKAIKADPDYALVYAALADCYGWFGYLGDLPQKEAYSKAIELLKKALDIDDTLAEAHQSLAALIFYFNWDWKESEREFKRALSLNPSLVGNNEYAWLLMALGRHDEAIAEAKRTLRLDPFTTSTNLTLVYAYYFARRYDQAIAQYRLMAELQPGDSRVYSSLAETYEQMERYEDAVKARQKAMTLSGKPTEEVEALGRAYNESGSEGYWMWRLERLKGRYDRYPSPGLRGLTRSTAGGCID